MLQVECFTELCEIDDKAKRKWYKNRKSSTDVLVSSTQSYCEFKACRQAQSVLEIVWGNELKIGQATLALPCSCFSWIRREDSSANRASARLMMSRATSKSCWCCALFASSCSTMSLRDSKWATLNGVSQSTCRNKWKNWRPYISYHKAFKARLKKIRDQ